MPEPTPDLTDRPAPAGADTEVRGADPTPDLSPDLAATPGEPGAPVGRDRLVRSLTHPSRQQVVVAVLLAVVGFAAMTQVKAQSGDDAYAGYREQDLIDVLNGLTDTTQRAQREITRLEQAKADLQSSSEARQAALTEARKQADTLDILAGTVPVTGPGIRVTIDETDGAVSIDSLLDMIQELRGAGAEAMQFNGQVRVVASTSFEDGVGGIYVDDQLLEPPYVLDAIGEPTTLHSAMVFREGPIEQLEGDGATVTVDELPSLDIKSVTTPEETQFLQPVAPQ
jgi:uncharacterized protein YlxW (UPF0749 family)